MPESVATSTEIIYYICGNNILKITLIKMQRSSNRFVLKFLFLISVIFISFTADCQPPVTPTPSEILPNQVQVDPKTLSQTQLQSLLSDKNKENAGKDKNAGFAKNNKLDKDSLIKDNIKATTYKADQTYGENVFENAAETDLSELSTPPLDYPIGVGDNIVVSLWGAAEFQESYVVARDGAIFPRDLARSRCKALLMIMPVPSLIPVSGVLYL